MTDQNDKNSQAPPPGQLHNTDSSLLETVLCITNYDKDISVVWTLDFVYLLSIFRKFEGTVIGKKVRENHSLLDSLFSAGKRW